MSLPNFIVVGTAKSGTTSLWHYLLSHPEIFMPSIKETNYFSNDLMTRNNPIKNVEQYKALFAGKENYKCRGEVSNAYLTHAKEVAPRIKNLIPECRILIIVRYPVDRLYSRYWHAVRDQYIKDTFSKFSESAKSFEVIGKKIEIYVKTFGQEKVKIVFLEEFQKQLDIFTETLFSFLGVKIIDLPDSHLNKSGSTKSRFINDFILKGPAFIRLPAKILPPKYRANFREYIKMLNTNNKPKINPDLEKQLSEYFIEDINIIQKFAGRLPVSWINRM